MNQDGVWKEAIEYYFEYFLTFFFPEVAADVDHQRGYEFLDKELAEISQGGEVGGRIADVLVKVYLKDGSERWLVIHVEVQGYWEQDFARRMFTYNYRAFDRYGVDVVSLAVLADRYPDYRPRRFEVSHWGFRCLFEFPIAKVLDYRERWEELEASDNPFAVVVMAHLKEQEAKREGDEYRFHWKMRLVRMLYERGYSKGDVLLLYRFIDGLMELPKPLARQFHRELIEYEEEKKMPFITTAERIGIEKGIQQGIQQGIQIGRKEGERKGERKGLLEAIELGLTLKFPDKGLRVYPEISQIEDVDMLRMIVKAIKMHDDLNSILTLARQRAEARAERPTDEEGEVD